MEIRTERLILRPMRAGDEEAVYDYGGDRSIDMIFDLPFDDFEEAAEYVRRSAEEWIRMISLLLSS